MGGMMIFPGNQVDRKQTTNGARGFNRKISDRMDLTLECTRRYYRNDFTPPAIPRDLGTYLEFRRLSIEFTKARNRRIDQLALSAA